MPMIDLEFRLFITNAQYEQMKQQQDEGEFGSEEALELCRDANDCALTKVDA